MWLQSQKYRLEVFAYLLTQVLHVSWSRDVNQHASSFESFICTAKGCTKSWNSRSSVLLHRSILIRRFVEATTLCCSTRNCAMLPKELSLLRTRLIDSLLVQISPSAFAGLEIFRKLRNVMQIEKCYAKCVSCSYPHQTG